MRWLHPAHPVGIAAGYVADRVPGIGVTEPTEGALRAREDGHRGSWLTFVVVY